MDMRVKPLWGVKLFLIYCLLVYWHSPNVNAQSILPANLFADTLHAPFYQGVASGDPLPDKVILWTRITPTEPLPPSVEVVWQIATDSFFNNLVNSGVVTTTVSKDWTVKIDADGLQAGTVYYYRFFPPFGNFSATGRTQTAPDGNIERVRLAVGSCSSIYSGFFNAYRRISERTDLDAFIHLGDYVYDFADDNELVRIPTPFPQEPNNISEWRNLHRYYLLDPDLRAARAQLPWIVIWDNHDVPANGLTDAQGAWEAFWEYLPIRQPDTLQNNLIYRSFRFGNLVQLLMTDVLLHRNESQIAPGIPSMLGNTQYEWLTNELLDGNSQWRIIGSQKMVGTWSIVGLPPLGFGDGDVADLNSWDGFTDERERVLNFLHDNALDNNIFISGDAHISMCMDLPLNPTDSLTYNSETGEGSLAVEMLPSSISRGNFDEAGLTPFLINAITTAFKNINPHEVYTELTQHGYGILDINPDSTVAQIWYSPILSLSNAETLGARLVTYSGQNHWHRQTADTVTQIIALPVNHTPTSLKIYPNPAQESIFVELPNILGNLSPLFITDIRGKTVLQVPITAGSTKGLFINLHHLPAGYYWVHWQNAVSALVKW